MPSSNRVVKFTNILNLSAIKFHIPPIQFLKGSESSAAMRRNSDGFTGTKTYQVHKARNLSSSGDSTTNLLFHSWINHFPTAIRDCQSDCSGLEEQGPLQLSAEDGPLCSESMSLTLPQEYAPEAKGHKLI